MKICKLVFGILSVAFSSLFMIPNCIGAFGAVMQDANSMAYIVCAVIPLIFAAGIVSIARHNKITHRSTADFVLYAIALVFCLCNPLITQLLFLQAIWCVICAFVSFIDIIYNRK